MSQILSTDIADILR